jgi:hypothetical protein
VAYVLALEIWKLGREPLGPSVPSLDRGLAVLLLEALAIERLIQPISTWLGPNTSRRYRELLVAQAGEDKTKIAQLQGLLDRDRDLTAVVCWGLASAFGYVAAALTHVTVFRLLFPQGAPDPMWDLLITGLVVGAGTKPINDLWTRLQNPCV